MSAIEALYIFDEHNTLLLEHTYTGRPPPSTILLPLYLAHPSPRPSLIYLPTTNPPTLLYSTIQDSLLFLAPCSADREPLQVLEFLHRVADVLEEFLGSPLLASKIEANLDVVAQLLSEMVDGGVVACTEGNALRDVVERPEFLRGLLGGVGLPSTTPSSLTPSATPFSLSSRPGMSGRLSPGAQPQNAASPVPWRRANVRHTSNELYVDIVETLDVVLAPSGRPLSAIANGTIAFTAKVSGVPDLFLQLGCPGGISNTLSLPVFHPCVRLKRWSERPGELSFVPPDGRFILAGYEVDLLGPAALNAFSKDNSKAAPKLNIPATVAIITSLGPSGADFEVRLSLNPRYAGKPSTSPLPSATGSSFPRTAGLGRGLNGPTQGTTAAPSVEEVVVHIPLPASVKNIADLRVSKGAGEAGYAPGERSIEWRINSRDVGHLMARDRGVGTGAVATLYGTVVGLEDNGDGLEGGPVSLSNTSNPYDYDDGATSSYQSPPPSEKESRFSSQRQGQEADEEQKKRVKRNKVLMPSCAAVSFSVKGWLPSGIKVESLAVDAQRSRGLGQGVTPYKGVKYVCVSRRGVECRG